MWHGMKLSGLLRLAQSRPSLHWSRMHRFLPLPLFGAYNSAMGALESLVYGKKIEETELIEPPLIVLGFWRSGTTLLQNLLSHDPQFGHLNLYQAIFPWHFLLSETVAKKLTAPFVPKTRPMDNMAVSWDAPQEDDIATAVMSQVSPYMFLSKPADLKSFWHALDFDSLPAERVEEYKSCLKLLLKKMTLRSKKRIMLKSPFHTYHVPTLLDLYPKAKFLYIHRNPYDVWRSGCHLRRRMIEENTLGKAVYDSVEEEIMGTYQAAFQRYETDRHQIPEGNLHEISYEQLAADPIQELGNAYSGLNLNGFDAVEESIRPTLVSLKQYKKNSFQHDPEWVERIFQELQPAFERFGYEKPEVESSASKAA